MKTKKGHVQELVGSTNLADFCEMNYGDGCFHPKSEELLVFSIEFEEYLIGIKTRVNTFLEDTKKTAEREGWVDLTVKFEEAEVDSGYYNNPEYHSARILVHAFRPLSQVEQRRVDLAKERASVKTARLVVETEAKERELLETLKKKYEED